MIYHLNLKESCFPCSIRKTDNQQTYLVLSCDKYNLIYKIQLIIDLWFYVQYIFTSIYKK